MAAYSGRALDEIAWRGAPLWERLSRPAPPAFDTARGAERLAHWCRVVARGDDRLLDRRIDWGGWTRDHCCRVLGGSTPPGAGHPAWVTTVLAFARAARRGVPPDRPAFLDSAPFGALLAPMLTVARDRLTEIPASEAVSATPEAVRELERFLVGRLSTLAAGALYAEFSGSLAGGPDILGYLTGSPEPPRTTQFDRFVQRHLDDGYEDLFLTYPVLARLLATTVDHWVAMAAEFGERFSRDRTVLGNGRILRLRAGLSDPHREGRSVLAVDLDNGRRLIYKPRSVSCEAAFARACDWCNREAPAGWLALTAPRVHERAGYGWIEAVEPADCPDRDHAVRFFVRVGELLCLLHALGTTDVNRENLLACGEHPVLVDAETLIQPAWLRPDVAGLPAELAEAVLAFTRSVAHTGMLPTWEVNRPEGTVFDLSGLATDAQDRSPVRGPRFHNVNTDSMLLVNGFGTFPSAHNLPLMAGLPIEPSAFSDEAAAGFAHAWRWLAPRASELLRAAHPADLAALGVRLIVRPTRLYQALLARANESVRLRDGVNRSIELDRISLAFLDDEQRPALFGLLQGELDALELDEVPYFSAPAAGGVCAGVSGLFDESAVDRASRAPSRLREADHPHQLRILRGSLAAQAAHVAAGPDGARSEPEMLPAATRDELISAAREVGRMVRGAASEDGRSWLGIRNVTGSDRYRYEPLGEDLYSGSAGIGLFLAALARLTGSDRHAHLAERALGFAAHGWTRGSASWRAAWLRATGPGAMHGIASLAYALARAGQWLDRPVLVQRALDLMACLDADIAPDDRDCSIASGWAGAVLVALRLHHDTGDPGLLARAAAWGEQILSRRTAQGNGPRAWPYQGRAPLAGFYLGAAGCSHALFALGSTAGDDRFTAAAAEALDYENTLFDETEGNWRDLRPASPGSMRRPFMTSWCHGAPGIALSRLAALDVREDARWSRDVAVAVATTTGHTTDDVDHLCCGNAGRIEVLLAAGQRLARPDLQAAAYRRAAWVIRRAEGAGGYRLAPGLAELAAAPSLMRGSAGIGYQWLRLAAPTLVRSLLMLE